MQKGSVGTGLEMINHGDLVSVLHGGQTRYALREEGGRFNLWLLAMSTVLWMGSS
jgi:hypothetical protein